VLQSWLAEKLNGRKENHLLRQLTVHEGLVDFTSNDYLGLSRSKELSQRITNRLHELDLYANGATGSRLLSGNNRYTVSVEKKLATIFQSEAALILNSGYAANLAVLSSLPQRGDTILYDELAHACIKDGARLSLAARFSFRHNDLDDLEQKLMKAQGKIFIAVESIYSMDGDECPLKALAALAETFNASIILDEAHSTGVRGHHGSGLATALGLQDKIAIRIYTFGKAMGVHGAAVVGSQLLADYLVNFSRPFIYTTALPPHSIASIEMAFDHVAENIQLQRSLLDKIALYKASVAAMVNQTNSHSAIQTALFPGNENARQAACDLRHHGFDVRPILSPTVPINAERLRICLHTFNNDEDIVRLASLLNSVNVHM
jgi:8-amino-7-oxononanoate synthase